MHGWTLNVLRGCQYSVYSGLPSVNPSFQKVPLLARSWDKQQCLLSKETRVLTAGQKQPVSSLRQLHTVELDAVHLTSNGGVLHSQTVRTSVLYSFDCTAAPERPLTSCLSRHGLYAVLPPFYSNVARGNSM